MSDNLFFSCIVVLFVANIPWGRALPDAGWLASGIDDFEIGERQSETVLSVGKLNACDPLGASPRDRYDRPLTVFGMSNVGSFSIGGQRYRATGQ